MTAAFTVAFNELLENEPTSSRNSKINWKNRQKGVDINELYEGSERKWGLNVITDKNEISVGAHGSPNGMMKFPGRPMGAEFFAEKIRATEKWQSGIRTVRLYSCNTGYGSGCIAQQLAVELGSDAIVIAPDEFLHPFTEGGVDPDWVLGPKSWNTEQKQAGWMTGGEGNWHIFYGSKK